MVNHTSACDLVNFALVTYRMHCWTLLMTVLDLKGVGGGVEFDIECRHFDLLRFTLMQPACVTGCCVGVVHLMPSKVTSFSTRYAVNTY